MGRTVGVHTDEEVKDLSEDERRELKLHILNQLREILAADDVVLPELMEKHDDIRQTLRAGAKTNPLASRLRGA